jgi:hypothetical protein
MIQMAVLAGKLKARRDVMTTEPGHRNSVFWIDDGE